MTEFSKIAGNLSASSDESDISAVVLFAAQHELTDFDIAFLADKLANSGTVFNNLPKNSLDIASTGGPSSLSTLLTPLFLRYMDRAVPKLSVPGRPAGGIDVLATIPNYRIHLQPSEVILCLNKCGYVHFMADENYAPLDAKMFTIRQRIGVQSSVSLVIASILAKKLAVGLKHVGLDIRVGTDNNFGISFEKARLNALRFCSVSHILGINAKCVLTDGSRPYQPMIGRGEALIALNQVFEETAGPWLKTHMTQCWNMAAELTGYKGRPLLGGSNIRTIFSNNLDAQGSSLDEFHKRVELVMGHPRLRLLAKSQGWAVLKLGIIRSILIDVQQTYQDREGSFPDPIGIELLVTTGDSVENEQTLILVRAPENLHKELEHRLLSAVEIINYPITESKKDPWEVISNA